MSTRRSPQDPPEVSQEIHADDGELDPGQQKRPLETAAVEKPGITGALPIKEYAIHLHP
jgi:hypothetical protein